MIDLNDRILVLDGAMGTVMNKEGMLANESTAEFCYRNPHILSKVQAEYIAAGSDVIYAATFGVSRLSEDRIGATVKEAVESALDAAFEAKRMSGLVSRLLTLARSDSGRLDPGSESVDLSEMCRMVAGQQEYAAEEKDIGIVTDIEDGISVRGDEAMLIRVLLNLVDNAIKYGRTGGYVRIALERRGDEAVMSVADDGEGISEKDLARIWERFYRVDPSRSEEGSGLGLSMVEALVKAHGGRVEAESVPGEGSCFRVYLPVGRN